jgi:hypothetical protein
MSEDEDIWEKLEKEAKRHEEAQEREMKSGRGDVTQGEGKQLEETKRAEGSAHSGRLQQEARVATRRVVQSAMGKTFVDGHWPDSTLFCELVSLVDAHPECAQDRDRRGQWKFYHNGSVVDDWNVSLGKRNTFVYAAAPLLRRIPSEELGDEMQLVSSGLWEAEAIGR